jgi:hypothetical protein
MGVKGGEDKQQLVISRGGMCRSWPCATSIPPYFIGHSLPNRDPRSMRSFVYGATQVWVTGCQLDNFKLGMGKQWRGGKSTSREDSSDCRPDVRQWRRKPQALSRGVEGLIRCPINHWARVLDVHECPALGIAKNHSFFDRQPPYGMDTCVSEAERHTRRLVCLRWSVGKSDLKNRGLSCGSESLSLKMPATGLTYPINGTLAC